MNWVATSILAVGLAGCSVIYNPSNLPAAPSDGPDIVDLPPDQPVIDADPAMLMLDPIAQGPLLEGQGIGGSQQAVLFISGENLIDGTTLTVAPTVANPDVSIHVDQIFVAVTHHSIGALITADLSPLTESAGLIDLDVTVTPPAPFESAAKTVTWQFKPLDTLTATGATAPPPADKLFSDVTLTGPINFTGTERVIIRAVSSITATGTISVNAAAIGKVPGPGGCAGGDGGTQGSCFGKGNGGSSGGGGGGGFNGAGDPGVGENNAGSASGSPEIANFTVSGTMAENKGGGGGGGSGGVGNGGEGGGSGGTIELTAGGNLDLTGATVTANGAKGQPAQGAALSSGGGGGAGGVVLLRSGGVLTPPTDAQVAGGVGGGSTFGGKTGGKGANGRIRADSPADVTVPNASYNGPMLVRPPSPVVRDAQTQFALHAKAGDDFTVSAKRPDGSVDSSSITAFAAGQKVTPTLQPGINRVCTVLTNGSLSLAEGSNCIEVVYIP